MHRFDDPHQIAFDESNARAFDRDIGPCAHCNSHIGSRERRRVVDPIPRHCNDRAAGFESFDNLDFLIRHQFRAEFIDAELTRD